MAIGSTKPVKGGAQFSDASDKITLSTYVDADPTHVDSLWVYGGLGADIFTFGPTKPAKPYYFADFASSAEGNDKLDLFAVQVTNAQQITASNIGRYVKVDANGRLFVDVTGRGNFPATLLSGGQPTYWAILKDVEGEKLRLRLGSFDGFITAGNEAPVINPQPTGDKDASALSISFEYRENSAANTVIGTVAATDNVGVVGYRFSAGYANINDRTLSIDGFFRIGSDGKVTLTAAGALSIVNNYEDTGSAGAPINSRNYYVEAGDKAGNWSTPMKLVLSETDDLSDNRLPDITASLTESTQAVPSLATASGDANAPTDVWTASSGTASFGSYTVNAAGQWSYTLDNSNSRINGLSPTQTLTDSFTFYTTGGTSQTVTVTITGANDAAVITGTTTGSVTEDAVTSTASGTLGSTDVDGTANLFQAVLTAAASLSGYGTYTVGTDGAWEYTLDNTNATVDALGAGATLTDTFAVLAADGTSQTVTVTITGANDAAVITGTTTGSVTEDAATSTASGTLGSTDVDGTANLFQAVLTAAESLSGYGTYTVGTDGAWAYTLDNTNATVDALSAGATLTDTFAVLAADGTSQTVTVTITGANDAAVITGTTTGSVTEDAGTSTASGTLGSTDVDGTANLFQAVLTAAESLSGYGTYTVGTDGAWEYTLDNTNATVDALGAGATLTDMFAVLAADGTSQTVTVTITGANDAPVITITNIALSTDDGSSATDFITSKSAQTISATLSAALGAGEGLFGSVNGGVNWYEITNKVSGTSLSWTGVNLLSTGTSIQFAVRNAADVAGPLASQNYTLTSIELSAVAAGLGGFVINGQSAGDKSGYSVASAGDVNGDGLNDLIIGAYYADVALNADAGRTYVVFGQTGTSAINLSAIALGCGGFVINGQASSDLSGISVSGAGDVNGDGLADLIVGASQSDPAAGTDAGRSYVIFGKTSTSTVNLSAIASGSGGFVIAGQCANDFSGISVSGAGDVNGDGLADLIIGAYLSDPLAGSNAGRTYVVFGKTSSGPVSLVAIAAGSGGFVLNGQGASDNSGVSVMSAGDVNGDGLADLIVGANFSDPTSGNNAGRTYIVFGKTSSTAINLCDVATGSGGFAVNGISSGEASGFSVASAGDVNGDGLADIIIGAPFSDPDRSNAGRSYVVFGKTSTTAVNLSAVASGTGGFVIRGECADDSSGLSVASAGDINGDGLSDLIIGAYGSDPSGLANAGRTYIVFGKTDTAAIELSAVALGSGGFAINGQGSCDTSGRSVSSAGDVNGDGLADLIVGVGFSDAFDLVDSGRSYVIFGSTSGPFYQTLIDWLGTSGNDTRSDGGVVQTLVAGAGNDTLTATAASVLFGGSGDDEFTIGQTMITALQNPMGLGGNTDQLVRIDGGTGLDTIKLSGSGLTFDLTKVSNQAAGNTTNASRLTGIEIIDVTGSGNNILKLDVFDVLDMGSANTFLRSGRQQLMVVGDSGDRLDLGSTTWTKAASVTINTISYDVWNHNTKLATVYTTPGLVLPMQTISGLTINADTGESNLDFLTRTASQTISAMLSAVLGAGDDLYGSVDGGANWVKITDKISSGTTVSWTSVQLQAGQNSIQMQVRDATDNAGAVASQAYTLDTTAPTQLVSGIALSSDTGESGSDFITSTSLQSISATLNNVLGLGDELYGSTNGGANWVKVTDKVSGTAVLWAGVTLAGSSSIQFEVRDRAGNAGATATQAYTLDRASPLLTISGTAISNDTGDSGTDFVTGAASQTISATLSGALAVGEELYGSLDSGATWAKITSKAAGTTINWDGATLVSGANAIQLAVRDTAGNVGVIASQGYSLYNPLTVIADGSNRIVVDNGAIDRSEGNTDLSYYTYVDGNGNGNDLVDILYFQFNEPVAEGKYFGLVNGEEAAFFVMGNNTLYVIADDTVSSDGLAATWNGSFDVAGTMYTFSYDYALPQTVGFG